MFTFFLIFTVFTSSVVIISSSSKGVHFDHYQRCYASLAKKKVLEGCLEQAKAKWNLTGPSSNSTLEASKVNSCCAMYEALNCAQNRSCDLCAEDVLDDFAHYRRRMLQSMTFFLCTHAKYKDLAMVCPQAVQVPLDIKDVCPGRKQFSDTALLVAIVLFILGIIACVGVLLAVFCARNESDDQQQGQQQKNSCLAGKGSKATGKRKKSHSTLSLKASPKLIKRQSSLSSTLMKFKTGYPRSDGSVGSSLSQKVISVKSAKPKSSSSSMTLKQVKSAKSKKSIGKKA